MANEESNAGPSGSHKKKPSRKGTLQTAPPDIGPAPSPSATPSPLDDMGGKSALRGKLLEAKRELMKMLGAKEFLGASLVGRASNVSSKANIAGFAIGEKVSNKRSTNRPAVTVFVARKLARSAVDRDALVPPTITVGGQDYPTDVVEVGEVVAHIEEGIAVPDPGVIASATGFYTERIRPAPCGSSIGHVGVTAGTLGALVEVEGKLMILSNNHVLANLNNARKGDRIVQPGPVDGGAPRGNTVANLFDFVPLDFNGDNEVDCAVAHRTTFDHVDPESFRLIFDPEPVSTDDIDEQRMVRKDGRTTGYTLGRLLHKDSSVRVQYGFKTAVFHDQYFIAPAEDGPFSEPGDSGSLIVTADTKQPAALLFAGSASGTFANPIEKVMRALNINRFITFRDD